MNGNRNQSSYKPLYLKGAIIYEIECLDTYAYPVSYMWNCSKVLPDESLVPCEDPDNLFGIELPYEDLNLPVSYFMPEDVMEFTLTVTRNGKTSSAKTRITVSGLNTLHVSLACVDSQCRKYTAAKPPILSAEIANETYDPNNNLHYNWTVAPTLDVALFQNRLKIVPDASVVFDTLQIVLQVFNSTHQGITFANIPYNVPPLNGTLVAEPVVGQALDTRFSMITLNWLDEDVPIVYQFFFTFDTNSTIDLWSPITNKQKLTYTTTWLPGKEPNVTVYLHVVDAFDAQSLASTNITVEIPSQTISEAVRKIKNIISSLSSVDLFEVLKKHIAISKQFLDIEENVLTKGAGCPECSGHGNCLENTCICDEGWALQDCSLEKDTYQEIIIAKTNAIQELIDSYNNMESDEMRGFVFHSLQALTTEPEFNDDQIITKVQDVIEKDLKLTSNDTILDQSERESVAQILSNMIQYSSRSDCQCISELCRGLEKKATDYLAKLSSSALADSYPNEEPLIIKTPSFDLFTVKTTPCTISNIDFQSDETAPIVKLIPLVTPTNASCAEEINAQLYILSDKNKL